MRHPDHVIAAVAVSWVGCIVVAFLAAIVQALGG